MNSEEIFNKTFERLAADIVESEKNEVRPLLAHYCSTTTLESILRGGQLWLSNPLFMNDLEEVKFGITTGVRVAQSNKALKHLLGKPEREDKFHNALNHYFDDYSNGRVFDLYLTCFSAHSPDDFDGRLSMWRAYGANGDGAALVIDVSSITNPEHEFNGLLMGKVQYGTTAEREAWLAGIVELTGKVIKEFNIPDDQLYLAAAALFERIKLMALFSKHSGFNEEKEWRLVYMSERDLHKRYFDHLSYTVGPRGIEPKLKLPVNGKVPWRDQEFDFKSIINRIILGPTASSPLAKMSMVRMFEINRMPELKDKLFASTIPLRPIN